MCQIARVLTNQSPRKQRKCTYWKKGTKVFLYASGTRQTDRKIGIDIHIYAYTYTYASLYKKYVGIYIKEKLKKQVEH